MRFQDISTRSGTLDGLLSGAEFDENACLMLDRSGGAPDRIDLLRALTAGKDVIHLGFCDHLPSIDARRTDGRWLHDHMRASARRCLGVDIDADAVAYVRDRLGVDDIVCADITDEASRQLIAGGAWDYLLIPEVLEHIGDPVRFLKAIRTLHGADIGRVVITVPNAFRAGSFRNALRGVEAINSDHRFYFTPYTLMKVATDAGFAIESIAFAQFSRSGRAKSLILKRFPMLSENLVLIARF
jgi:hypothetical protein